MLCRFFRRKRGMIPADRALTYDDTRKIAARKGPYLALYLRARRSEPQAKGWLREQHFAARARMAEEGK